MSSSGISPSFLGLSRSPGWVTHVLLTRSRLCPRPKPGSSLHLHVLSTPPAFVLSQDQTLREELLYRELSRISRGDGRTRSRPGCDRRGFVQVPSGARMRRRRSRTWTHRSKARAGAAGRSVRMLLSFQRPPRLCPEGSPPLWAHPRTFPSGQWSVARPPGPVQAGGGLSPRRRGTVAGGDERALRGPRGGFARATRGLCEGHEEALRGPRGGFARGHERGRRAATRGLGGRREAAARDR